MSEDNKFISEVAAIFEENCLHITLSIHEIERAILFATDYCLERQ